jgi:hypothetical protein
MRRFTVMGRPDPMLTVPADLHHRFGPEFSLLAQTSPQSAGQKHHLYRE